VKRAKQVLVKLSDGEYAIAVELSAGTTIQGLLRQLLIKAWQEKQGRVKREKRAG
jgi:hypothetical protein